MERGDAHLYGRLRLANDQRIDGKKEKRPAVALPFVVKAVRKPKRTTERASEIIEAERSARNTCLVVKPIVSVCFVVAQIFA